MEVEDKRGLGASAHDEQAQSQIKAITFLLKAPSFNIALIFTINVDSEQVSYTDNDRNTDHIEYTGGEGI